LLNAYQRLHLVQKAIADNLKLKASDVEFKLPKPSYTIETLIYLQEKYPKNEFSIIMGSDSYSNITKWKNYELLLNNYQIIIYERPNFSVIPVVVDTKSIQILNAPLLEISATFIRSAIKNKKSIKYLVPDCVLDEIERNGYYR
ncbi:MAG: nicotinate (nicotinamide) nucleotide adenylyltransferase, partial [Deinococcales bacterium]|nr:nicotinate (nicotinamide) nucleotide adenylyltransferase [Chitinophagaceae bacterium]